MLFRFLNHVRIQSYTIIIVSHLKIKIIIIIIKVLPQTLFLISISLQPDDVLLKL